MTAKAMSKRMKDIAFLKGTHWYNILKVTTAKGRGINPILRATRSLWSLSACNGIVEEVKHYFLIYRYF